MPDMEKVLNDLRNARTLINDGYNERGTTLTGDRCKYCVNAIDAAIIKLKEQEAEPEIEGGGSTWWYVCSECRGAIDNNDRFCKHCGARLKRTVK